MNIFDESGASRQNIMCKKNKIKIPDANHYFIIEKLNLIFAIQIF